MITKEIFTNVITKHQIQSKKLDQLTELGFNIWDTQIIDFGWQIFDIFIETNFDEEGKDWIFWWLYERNETIFDQAWDEYGNKIPTETIDDLWNLIEKHRI